MSVKKQVFTTTIYLSRHLAPDEIRRRKCRSFTFVCICLKYFTWAVPKTGTYVTW